MAFEGALDAIFISDQSSSFIAVNRAACELTGYSRDELLAMSIPDLHDDVDLEAYRRFHARIMAGEETLTTAVLLRKDGSKVATEFSNRAVRFSGTVLMHTTARDITERTRAQGELIAEKDFSEAMLASLPGVAYLFDENLRFQRWNTNFEVVTGYNASEIAELTPLELFEGDDREHVAERIAEAFATGESSVEANFVAKGGTATPYLFTGRRIEIGGASFLIGMGIDISARKAAEKALRESEERYRSLFEDSPIGMYRTAPEGRILAANPALIRILRYDSFAEMAGLDLNADGYADSDRRDAFMAEIERTGSVSGRETALRTRDGSTVHVRETSRIVRETSGAIAYFEGAFEDVTAQRAAQQERDLIFDLAVDLFCVIGSDGYFKQLNAAWESTLGWSTDELMAAQFFDFVHPGDQAATLEATEKLLATNREVLAFENRCRTRNGSYRWLSWNVRPLPDVGLLYAVARDITKGKQLEEQLFHAQKMEAIGRLAGGVAHDFNNLLQSLLSHSQLVRTFSTRPEELVKVADEVEQQVLRGVALTRQLLLFSRRETARRRRLDLNRLIEGHARLLRRLVRENIAFAFDLAPGPLPVDGDRGQLEQVLMNLVVNASDALESGGGLTIRSGGDGDGTVWMAVEDTGPGVPVEVRSKVFEPFFTTKPANKGTGLGLSVVHGIVIQHGGRIEVADRVGGGAVFRVTLPRASHSGGGFEHEKTDRPVPEAGHGERVLVVEDEPAAREALETLMTSLGYAPLAVSSAEEALELPHEPSFAVLITDLMLPGKPGDELAVALKDRWPELAVILMSGYTDNEAVRRGVGEGDIRFLQKPFDINTLAAELHAALASTPPL